MTRSLSRRQAIVLGIVLFLSVLLGAMGLFAVGSRQLFSDSFRVRTGFSNIEGIRVGTQVEIRGVNPGEVEAIESTDIPGKEVMLHMRIDGKMRKWVKSDSKVKISQRSLFADKIIDILPGQSGQTVQDDIELAGLPTTDLTANLEQASANLNSSLKDIQEGKGPIGSVTKDLNKATKKLNHVLDQVNKGEGTIGKLLKEEELYMEALLTMKKVNGALDEFAHMKKQFNGLFDETETTVKETKQMVASIKQNADAIKSMPIVRSYIVDANKELNRPDSRRHRLWFEEGKLFEPGRAVLTGNGKKILTDVAEWLNKNKDEGSEIVVAAFADAKHPSAFAKTLTDKQSQAVVDHLRGEHNVHRVGWWWWSNRTVKAIGCGNAVSPVPGDEDMPARVEVILFVPIKS